MQKTYERLVTEGVVHPAEEPTPPVVPMDLGLAMDKGVVRAPTHIVSTISDDRGEEPSYCGVYPVHAQPAKHGKPMMPALASCRSFARSWHWDLGSSGMDVWPERSSALDRRGCIRPNSLSSAIQV